MHTAGCMKLRPADALALRGRREGGQMGGWHNGKMERVRVQWHLHAVNSSRNPDRSMHGDGNVCKLGGGHAGSTGCCGRGPPPASSTKQCTVIGASAQQTRHSGHRHAMRGHPVTFGWCWDYLRPRRACSPLGGQAEKDTAEKDSLLCAGTRPGHVLFVHACKPVLAVILTASVASVLTWVLAALLGTCLSVPVPVPALRSL